MNVLGFTVNNNNGGGACERPVIFRCTDNVKSTGTFLELITLQCSHVKSRNRNPNQHPPHQNQEVFCDRYVDYQGEPREWLLTMPAPVADTQAVRFSRVSKTLTFQGRHIHRGGDFKIPADVDADDFVQGFVDDNGLCAESYNAAGEVVAKYVCRSETKSFI